MACKRKKYIIPSKPKQSISFRDGSLTALKRFRGDREESLYSRLRLLEGIIHDKTLEGDRKGVRKALREFAELWISLIREEF